MGLWTGLEESNAKADHSGQKQFPILHMPSAPGIAVYSSQWQQIHLGLGGFLCASVQCIMNSLLLDSDGVSEMFPLKSYCQVEVLHYRNDWNVQQCTVPSGLNRRLLLIKTSHLNNREAQLTSDSRCFLQKCLLMRRLVMWWRAQAHTEPISRERPQTAGKKGRGPLGPCHAEAAPTGRGYSIEASATKEAWDWARGSKDVLRVTNIISECRGACEALRKPQRSAEWMEHSCCSTRVKRGQRWDPASRLQMVVSHCFQWECVTVHRVHTHPSPWVYNGGFHIALPSKRLMHWLVLQFRGFWVHFFVSEWRE